MKKNFFIVGLIVGAIGAWIIWPKTNTQTPTGFSAPESQKRRTPRSIGDLLEDCRSATTHQQRYQAYRILSRGARRDYEEALELAGVHDSNDSLNKEVTAILLAWANSNPQDAMAWSWENLRKSPRWEIAMREIMETWIASGDPAVLDFLKNTPQREKPLSVDERDEDLPLFLHDFEMSKIREWLYFYDSRIARAAWEQGIQPLLQYPPPPDFIDRLITSEEIIKAAKIWSEEPIDKFTLAKIFRRANELEITLPDSLDKKKLFQAPTSPSKPKSSASQAFAKARSQGQFWNAARQDLTAAMIKASTLELPQRQAAYLTMYDSWALANPGKEPDYELLPPEARAIWRDLAVIGPINDPLTSVLLL